MRVLNITKNAILAQNVRLATALKERIVGLIGTKNQRALFLKTRWGIHTFGMRFPIDVIIFDKNGVVQATKSNLVPNRLFFWNPRYSRVLELPADTLKHTNTTVGNQLELLP